MCTSAHITVPELIIRTHYPKWKKKIIMEKYGNIKTIYLFSRKTFSIPTDPFLTFPHYIHYLFELQIIRLYNYWFVGYHWERRRNDMQKCAYTWSNFGWFYEIYEISRNLIWLHGTKIPLIENNRYIFNVMWILQSCWEHSYLLRILFSWKKLKPLKLHWLILKQILEVKSICRLSTRYPPRRSTL